MKIRKMKKLCKTVIRCETDLTEINNAYETLYGISLVNFLKRRGVDFSNKELPKNTDTSDWRYKKKYLPKHMVYIMGGACQCMYNSFTPFPHFRYKPVLVGEITKSKE